MINYRLKLNRVRGELRYIENQIREVRTVASQFRIERQEMSLEIDKERISDNGYVSVNFNYHLLRMLELNEKRHQLLQNLATTFAVQLTIIFECLDAVSRDGNLNKDYILMSRYLLINIRSMMIDPALTEMPRDSIGVLVTKELFKYEDSEYPDIMRIVSVLREISDILCPPVVPK